MDQKKQKKWVIIGSIGAVVLLFVMLFVGSYNGLVDREAAVDQAQADLDAQLQRRFDLIPQLVSTVEGAAIQEQSVIAKVTEARTRYAGATSDADRLAAAGELDSALSRLLVVVEAYPELASIPAFRDMMVQLEGTENRVAQARRDYNAAVTEFNTAIRRFPRSIVASFGGFERRPLFEAAAGAETAPTVTFDLNG